MEPVQLPEEAGLDKEAVGSGLPAAFLGRRTPRPSSFLESWVLGDGVVSRLDPGLRDQMLEPLVNPFLSYCLLGG